MFSFSSALARSETLELFLLLADERTLLRIQIVECFGIPNASSGRIRVRGEECGLGCFWESVFDAIELGHGLGVL